MRPVTNALVAAWLGLALVACGDTTGSIMDVNPAVPTSGALIGNNGEGFGNHEPISLDPRGPALEAHNAEFWAVQGKQRGVVINYAPEPGDRSPRPFLRLTIPGRVQLVAPDGRRVARGDSLLIKVQVVPGKLEAMFSPHGLVFADSIPVELAISYASGDTRARPVDQLGMWFLPTDGTPVEEQWSRVDQRNAMVVARIYHFSNYAVAY